MDTGTCYGVRECAEIAFRKNKMINGEELAVLEEKMNALEPPKMRSTNFLYAIEIRKRLGHIM